MIAPPSPETLAELDRLDAEATAGPWLDLYLDEPCAAVNVPHRDIYIKHDGNPKTVGCATFEPEDAALIVALRNAAPQLIAAARQLATIRALVDAYRNADEPEGAPSRVRTLTAIAEVLDGK